MTVERLIALEGAVNFRDLGGYATEDGLRTRWRVLFRADGLSELTETDLEVMREFLKIAGSPLADDGPLPESVIAAARRARGTRSPYAADLPLQALRDSRIPLLVASGAHYEPIERNMTKLAATLDAQRIIAPGAGHFVTAADGFADRLETFLTSL